MTWVGLCQKAKLKNDIYIEESHYHIHDVIKINSLSSAGTVYTVCEAIVPLDMCLDTEDE